MTTARTYGKKKKKEKRKEKKKKKYSRNKNKRISSLNGKEEIFFSKLVFKI